MEDVRHAVSSLGRLPLPELRRPGPGRAFLLRALRALTGASNAAIARFAGVSPQTAGRAPSSLDPTVLRVATVCRDPRFRALDTTDIRQRWPRLAGRA